MKGKKLMPTKKTAKKTTRRNSKTTPTKEDLMETVRNKMNLQEDFDDTDSDFDDEDEDEEKYPLDSHDSGFDIFDFIDATVKNQFPVRYSIKKDGAIIGTQMHPFSWEKVGKKYGKGNYQVQAKNDVTKRILKTQSERLDGAHLTEDGEASSSSKKENTSNNFMEMMAMLKGDQEEARREERERSKEMLQIMTQNQDKTMQLMIAALGNNSKDDSGTTLQMMTMLGDKFSQSIERVQDNTNRLMEKVFDRLDRVEEKFNGEGQLRPNDLIKMLKDSETSGFKMYERLMGIADMRAEEKAILMGSSGSEDKSTTDRLIETLAPVVIQALNPAARLQGKTQSKIPSLERELPDPEKYKKKPTQTPKQKVQTAKPSSMPSFKPEAKNQSPKTPEQIRQEKIMRVKKQAIEAVLPLIGQCLMEQKTAVEAKDLTISALTNQFKAEPAPIFKHIGYNELEAIAKQAGLPDEVYPWLQEYHGELIKYADSKIEAASNDSDTNSQGDSADKQGG